ncbi:thioredoxin-like protein [Clathrospora elynae]|uniref:Thioredoxin-like protein n=1 Tax=Clathrospora elynae TaxID=706981 RepID=A0A6A5SMQ3_9PLEO|nr:thioredoxin-like protein [Clathrospora elynae]
MASAMLEFNYDISCPFAYIASTRVKALAERTNVQLIYRPVLLGAIYRATAAPQGAGGSASDVFNPTKKARTLKRYKIAYHPPPQHPRKTVNALRLLCCVEDQEERRILTEKLFKAYWVEGRDVNNDDTLLDIARESGIDSASTLDKSSFSNASARRALEMATAEAIQRGAFGVPGFWVPNALWVDVEGEQRRGRFFWGQDRMHFVEATLLSLNRKSDSERKRESNGWEGVQGLRSMMPRCMPFNKPLGKVKLEFWFDFSSPWAFLGYTQLARLQRTFGPSLEIVMKPFLLGILFREIGAPNLPMMAVSRAKAVWSRQDHADWTDYWNAVNVQDGQKDGNMDFYWADTFPIRTPTVLRVALVEPKTTALLYSACWEKNMNVSDDSILSSVLEQGGYNGAELIAQANQPDIKAKLREVTAEAKSLGICGVPTYRVLRQDGNGTWNLAGGLVWGQDEINVVEDVIAGWEPQSADGVAEVGRVQYETGEAIAKL